jgi:alpha-tubulin suppressor-like RCC1 family protein
MFTCALDNQGTPGLSCWGKNDRGQLGINNTIDQSLPTGVTQAGFWTDIVAGAHHMCAIAGTGLLCWGDNTTNAIGQGSTPADHYPQPTAVTISGGTAWESPAAGNGFSCAVDNDGTSTLTRYCWGTNASYQLGLETTNDPQNQPTSLAAENLPWTQLTAGDEHTCGVDSNDAIYCWGSDDNGQLGDGNDASPIPTPAPPVPTTIPGADWWSSVTAGAQHTCAIDRSLGLFCWGSNEHGQLGVGDAQLRTAPTTVAGEWSVVTAGGAHTCAINNSAELHCWGSNETGQLGIIGAQDGMDAWAMTPRLVER